MFANARRFKCVRYEDVDAATLVLEEPPAIVVKSVQDRVGERFGFARPRKTVLPDLSSHAVAA